MNGSTLSDNSAYFVSTSKVLHVLSVHFAISTDGIATTNTEAFKNSKYIENYNGGAEQFYKDFTKKLDRLNAISHVIDDYWFSRVNYYDCAPSGAQFETQKGEN